MLCYSKLYTWKKVEARVPILSNYERYMYLQSYQIISYYVDTSDWSTETLDTHIADVRNMYLRALEQDEKSKARASDPVVLTDVSARGARE